MKRSARKAFVSAVVLGLGVFAASNALAQEITTTDEKDGYGYAFSDDPLAAGQFGPNDATIKVRPAGVRITLIRPRTSFVNEMLKSVENL